MVGATSNSRFSVGEQDSSELEECLLNPETRNVEQIIIKDYHKAEKMLEMFMGIDVEDRRQYILDYEGREE